jgi:hypothetical protein
MFRTAWTTTLRRCRFEDEPWSDGEKLYLGAGDLLDAVRWAFVVRTIRLRLTNKRTWQKVVFTRPLPKAVARGRTVIGRTAAKAAIQVHGSVGYSS